MIKSCDQEIKRYDIHFIMHDKRLVLLYYPPPEPNKSAIINIYLLLNPFLTFSQAYFEAFPIPADKTPFSACLIAGPLTMSPTTRPTISAASLFFKSFIKSPPEQSIKQKIKYLDAL